MNEEEFLKLAFSRVDELIAEELQDRMSSIRCTPYRLRKAHESLLKLREGGDADYDWPEIGWLYASWFHARRVFTSLAALNTIFKNAEGKHLHLVDLGCGTGAVLWAARLLTRFNRKFDLPVPSKLTYQGLDASVVMVSWARKLWGRVEPPPHDSIGCVEFNVNTWHHAPLNDEFIDADTQLWIAASYLFDASDEQRQLELRSAFAQLVERGTPDGVWLQSANTEQRRAVVDAAASELLSNGQWQNEEAANLLPTFRVKLTKTTRIRKDLADLLPHRFRPAVFVDSSREAAYGRLLKHNRLPERRQAAPRHLGSPYCALQQIYRNGQLDWTEDQKRAIDSASPAVIVGPAGSGKSVVLVERVRRLVEDKQRPFRVLVVAFNKPMVSQLARWLRHLLQQHNVTQERSNHVAIEVGNHHVEVSTFDRIVRQLVGGPNFHPQMQHDVRSIKTSNVRVATRLTLNRVGLQDTHKLAAPNFLLDEFIRVYYGLGFRSLEDFANGVRRGRGKQPAVRGDNRRRVFDCLQAIRDHLERHQVDYFTLRRLRAHERLVVSEQPLPEGFQPYTHVFVEECQDFLKADFEILFKLAIDVNEFVVTGDTCQSIWHGASTDVPRADGMREKTWSRLEAAIRTPYRIGCCLSPISESIIRRHGNTEGEAEAEEQLASPLRPRRDAIPGIRPVVVWCDDDAVAEKTTEIIRAFHDKDDASERGGEFTLLDKSVDRRDWEILTSSIRQKLEGEASLNITVASIETIKGQERWGIGWITSSGFRSENTFLECAYTATSRASFLLVIFIGPDTPVAAWSVLKMLDEKHIMFWDSESEDEFEAGIN